MKLNIIFIFSLFLILTAACGDDLGVTYFTPEQNTFSRTYNFGSRSFGIDMTINDQEKFIILGRSVNSADSDMLLFQTDIEGNIEWEKIIETPYSEIPEAVFYDSGIIFTVSTSFSPGEAKIRFSKFDNAGNIIFDTFLTAGKNDSVVSVIRNNSGNFIILSQRGYDDPFPVIINVDSEGNKLWENELTSVRNNFPAAVAQTDNNYVVAANIMDNEIHVGINIILIDESGARIHTKPIAGSSGLTVTDMAANNFGELIAAGYKWVNGSLKEDIVVLRLMPDGKVIGQSQHYDLNSQRPNKIINTNDKGYLITGCERGSFQSDLLLLKIDAQVNIEWKRLHDNHSNEAGRNAVELNGGYGVIGVSGSDFNESIYLLKTDYNGYAN